MLEIQKCIGLQQIVLFRNDKENKLAKPYKRLQREGHVKMTYGCNKFNVYCLLSYPTCLVADPL